MPSEPLDIPTAVIRPKRRLSLAWIVPVLALALVGVLVWRAWSMRGTMVVIHFQDGHGLRAGDDVRYRGIVVGGVESIELDEALGETLVTIAITVRADELARQGTLFWIERPHIGPSGVRGLETLIGPRYLALRPATDAGPPRYEFIGMEDPPVVDAIGDSDIEIIVQASQRGSLQPGGPVLFRQFRVGTVLSVNLAGDGSAVEARLHIENAYADLVRERTRFWDSGGVDLEVGITGIDMTVDSLEGVLVGSVSFATPPNPGAAVRTGHRFRLQPELDPEWLSWEPTLIVGSRMLPRGSRIPHMERARLSWETPLLRRDESRRGWVLVVEEGIMGPADLLRIDPDARDGSSRLDVAGKSIPISSSLLWESNGVGLVAAPDLGRSPWPARLMRAATEPEDCLALTSGANQTLPLAAARLTQRNGTWQVDESISLDDRWHGACVVSRNDGLLVGTLLVEDGIGRVALLAEQVLE